MDECSDVSQEGITPRIVVDMFKHIDKLPAHIQASFKVGNINTYIVTASNIVLDENTYIVTASNIVLDENTVRSKTIAAQRCLQLNIQLCSGGCSRML